MNSTIPEPAVPLHPLQKAPSQDEFPDRFAQAPVLSPLPLSSENNTANAKLRKGPSGTRASYLVPLTPVFRHGADHNSPVFGGIQRQPRRVMPSEQDKHKLNTFYRTFSKLNERSYVVAFVNSRSGGQTGGLLMQALEENVGATESEGKPLVGEVCDLSLTGEPASTIERLQRAPDRTRLLVCGGDGTVTWILTALEECSGLRGKLHRFPVGVVPLGTGNDLARSLGWGPRLYSVREIVHYLQWVGEADPVMLDQWSVILRPHCRLPDDHKLRTAGSHPQLVRDEELRQTLNEDLESLVEDTHDGTEVFVGYWQNYFTLGADARIARRVDQARNRSALGSCLFRSGLGKAVYAIHGSRNMCCNKDVGRTVSAMKVVLSPDTPPAAGQTLPPAQEVVAKSEAAQLMFLNINSYGAGMKVLPTSAQGCQKEAPAPDDGIMEVMGCRNMVSLLMAGMLGCGHLPFLASGEAVAFRLDEGCDMQADGEPWELDVGCDVLLEHHRQVTMLRAPESAHWSGHIQRDFWQGQP